MNELVENCLRASLENQAEFESLKDDLVSALASRQLTLLQLIEGLETGLTSRETQTRSKSCQLLAEIIQSVVLILSKEETLQLAQFFTSKFKDWSCLLGALEGCLFLIDQEKLPNEDIVFIIADAFFEYLEIQALKFSQRRLALKLLNLLIKKYGEMLIFRNADLDLIEKTVAAVDGEKDPRCLLLVFRLIQDVVGLYSEPSMNLTALSKSSEELFDVVACYFPLMEVDEEGSNKWEQQELVQELNKALTCTVLFSESCLTLIIEKSTSELKSAKLSSMLCLKDCASQFPFQAFIEFLSPLWSAIKPLVLSPQQDSFLAETSLISLQSLCQLCPSESHWVTMLDLVFESEVLLDTVNMLQNEQHTSSESITTNTVLLEKVAWLNDKSILKTLDKILGPMILIVEHKIVGNVWDFTNQKDVEQLLNVLHFLYRLLYSLSLWFQQESVAEIIQRKDEALKKLAEFLLRLHHLLDSIFFAECSTWTLWENILCSRMLILSMVDFLDLFSDMEYKDKITELFERITKAEVLKNDPEKLTGCFRLMICDESKILDQCKFAHLCADRCLSFLLPIELSVLATVRPESFREKKSKSQAEQVNNSNAEENLLTRLLGTFIRCLDGGKDMVLKRVASILSNWLDQASQDVQIQPSLGVIIRFLIGNLARNSMCTPNERSDSYQTILSCLVEFIRNRPANVASFGNVFQKELLSFSYSLMRLCSKDYQLKLLHDTKDSSSLSVYRCALLCGLADIKTYFSSSSEAFSFLKSCLTAGSNAAVTVGYIMQCSELMIDNANSCMNLLLTLSFSEKTQLVFIALSLRGLLSGSYSYAECKEISSVLVTRMVEILAKWLDAKNSLAQSEALLMRKAFQSLISEKHLFCFSDCILWKNGLQQQRAFTTYLEILFPILRDKEHLRTSAVLVFGYIIVSAETELVRIESKRVLPWILHLVEILQKAEDLNQELLLPVLCRLRALLKKSEWKENMKEQRNEILRSVLNAARYELNADVRKIAIECLLDSKEWLITSPDDLNVYFPQIMKVLTGALDDKKRRVRQTAVKCVSKLSFLKKKK